jgi:DNA-binding transcriptional LysR family regulator
MYPGVELRLHRYVVAIAEELSFTRASEKLHVAQPALSRQIQNLENYLGFALFDRDHRGVRLTVAGEAFAAESRLALFHAERAVDAARAAKGLHRGPWSLGYSPLVDLRILTRIRQHLTQAFPTSEIRLASAHSSEQADGLLRGKLQAGMVLLPVREPRLTTLAFFRQPMVLALAEKDRLAPKAVIGVADLHDLPLATIRSEIEPRFGEDLERLVGTARVRPRILHEATTQAELLDLVANEGVAALVMPAARESARAGIVFREFLDDFMAAEIGLTYLDETDSAILSSLRQFLLDTFQPLRRGRLCEPRTQQIALF